MKRLLSALLIASLPSAAWAAVGTDATPAVSSGRVLQTVPSTLYGMNVTTGATAGYVMAFDANAIPADGAVAPRLCLPIAANTGIATMFGQAGLRFGTAGIVLVFSSTGCFTKTSSATAFISGFSQ